MENNGLKHNVDIDATKEKLTARLNITKIELPGNTIDVNKLEKKHNHTACKGCDGICCSRKNNDKIQATE